MFRRAALTVGLVWACLWGLLLVAGANSAPTDGGTDRCYQPVAPADSLMRAQARHLERIGELIDQEAHDRFRALQDDALILAELANVNAGRATNDSCRTWSTRARDQALALARAASRQDLVEVQARAGRLESTCQSCHDLHRQPPASAAVQHAPVAAP